MKNKYNINDQDLGIEPGSFLLAVLSNNLTEAFGRADYINQQSMKDYCSFLYNYAPRGCWGSKETVNEWIESGGLKGNNNE